MRGVEPPVISVKSALIIFDNVSEPLSSSLGAAWEFNRSILIATGRMRFMSRRLTRSIRFAGLFLVGAIMLTPFSLAQAPVYVITPVSSSVVFNVKSSVSITGKFDKWDSTLVFTSTDINTGVLDVKIRAASVDTGSGMKNSKLKSKDFFARIIR